MLRWCDSYELFGSTAQAQRAYNIAGYTRITTATARTGSRCVEFYSVAANYCIRNLSSAVQILGMACGFRVSTLWTDNSPISFFNGTATQVSIRTGPAGELIAYRGNSVVLASSDTGLISQNTWYHLEAKAVFSNTAGSVEVRLNGVTVINVTGVDTVASGSEQATGAGHQAGRPGLFCDDIVIWDTSTGKITDFVGQARVGTLMPVSDTGTNTMVPSSGSDIYAMLNEVTADDDTTYVSATNVGDEAHVVIGNPPANVGEIKGAMVSAMARKEDAGTNEIQLGSNGTYGASHALDVSYSMIAEVFEQNPDTVSAWVPADLVTATIDLKRLA